jgi:hypothetical protein
MTWQPVPNQPLYPPMEEMKELLNIPSTFQTPPPSKRRTSTEWSGRPSNSAKGPKKQYMTSTSESAIWKDREKRSMDDLWQSVPCRKTSKLGSGKSTKPYSQTTRTTREKPRLSQRLGLPPPPNQKKEEPSRATRRSSFVYSLGSSHSSREPSPVRKGFSFWASAIPPAAASTPVPGTTPHVPKLSSPDSYDGKKRGRPARQWLARVLAWVELSWAAFPDERALILYMLHLLKDDAANWAQPHLQKVLNHKRGAIATVGEFIEEFSAAFDDPDAGRAAEQKILDLTQDSTATKSTVEYTMEFRNLMADLDWDDSALIASYRRGLHWKVRELMSQMETQPRNLEGWISAATQIDNIRRENEASCPPRPSTTPKKVTITTPMPVTVKRDPKALPNYVDEAERKRRRESGLCIKCGAAGHTIKDCKVG